MRIKSLLLTALLVMATAAGTTRESATELHFALAKSEPEAGASVHEISEVKLWFTEEPEDGTVSIRLLDGDQEAVEAGDVMQDEHDARVFSVALPEGVPMGSYTVAWRGMGADGHVVRESFDFTVGH